VGPLARATTEILAAVQAACDGTGSDTR
jgi:hypothetical protein